MQIRDIKKQIWMNKTEALSLAQGKTSRTNRSRSCAFFLLSYDRKKNLTVL